MSRTSLNSQPTRQHRRREPDWVRLRDEQLLDLRLCDLGLRVEGTVLEERIERLYHELDDRHIRLRPHCWLSDEWFAVDGVPGIAIPFYLAHPRLMKLEFRQMLEVEGGRPNWCMQILRHEAGHTIDNAYRLRRRQAWQKVFGRGADPYPEYYHPRPFSKDFVLHLGSWYAQSHPAEDFAETFAVWLNPDSRWRKTYVGWPALKKLKFVDQLMEDIADTPPPVRSREHVDPLPRLRKTLREHYRSRRRRFAKDYPRFYDADLRRLFSDDPRNHSAESAAAFLRRVRAIIRRRVAYWTGEHEYTIDQVLREMIVRCRQLRLRRLRPERKALYDLTVLVTVQTMNYLHAGHHRIAL